MHKDKCKAHTPTMKLHTEIARLQTLACMLQSDCMLLKGFLQQCASSKQDCVFICSRCNDIAGSDCQKQEQEGILVLMVAGQLEPSQDCNQMDMDWSSIQDRSFWLKVWPFVKMSCDSFLGWLLFVLAALVFLVLGITLLLLPQQPISAICKPGNRLFYTARICSP